MLKIGRDLNLGKEALHPEHRAELGIEHLESDLAVVADVAREIHRGHAAAADFPVDRVIHALKYGHQLAVAKWAGQRLAEQICREEFDRLIPLPLHPERLRERGFNQSAEIAGSLGKCLKLPVDRSIALRTRATPPQADLPHKERRKNVRGAFECRGDLSGQRLLLLDDVMTTGATVNECARVLKLHGAASVAVAVIARALRH